MLKLFTGRSRRMSGRFISAACAVALTVTSAAAAVVATPTTGRMYRGVNIAGGEFGAKLPGVVNIDYTYPTKAEIDYYANLGFTVIRVPFKWERLQPKLYGALSEPDRQALRDVVTYANAKGIVVVLDMHNYGQRAIGANFGTLVDIGSSQAPLSALTDAWARIAGDYTKTNLVWLGLMNEPHTMSAATWWPLVKKLIVDLRGRNIYSRVLVPGTAWTGAYSWITSGNAANASGIKDPANNMVFEVHQYLDADSSGTSASCVVGSGTRVADVIGWAKPRNVKLFMGEMGGSGQTQCGVEYRDMINRMEQSGVFLGWTAWGGGAWWPTSYPFRTLPLAWPNSATKTPHMQYLVEYLPKK